MGLFNRKKEEPSSSRPQGNVKPKPSGRNNERAHHRPAPRSSPNSFQPPGFPLPPPPPPYPYGLNHSRPVGSPAVGLNAPLPCHGQDSRHYHPIIVNQHYYLNAPPPSPHPHPPHPSSLYPSSGGGHVSSNLRLGSTSDLIRLPTNVVSQIVDDGLPRWHAYGTQLINQSAALFDQISSKFDDVMTLIDEEKITGNENDLFMYQQPQASPSRSADATQRSAVSKGNQSKKKNKDAPKDQTSPTAASPTTSGYFAKVDLYENSRLPFDLPSFRVPLSIYPLLCLAAQYAERVYEKPRGAERDAHVDANWKTGTKAMYIKSVPMDNMGTIVFAIRGTATFMDWAVNLNTAPTAPTGFLDDPGNFCHAGFLSVAKKMVAPVASRLRQLLEEDPGRCSHSLLITGHSAGGAIASLLYMHMLATSKAATSELNQLTGCFKRIHCIAFGSPPVSLLPLRTPHRHELRKSLFFSFVNEGDPVTRADKAYVKSLIELFAAPAPAPATTAVNTISSTQSPGSSMNSVNSVNSQSKPSRTQDKKSKSTLASKTSKLSVKPNKALQSKSSVNLNKPTTPGPVWRVPPSTLSNAGQIVVLRSAKPHAKVKRTKTIEERLDEGVVAQVASDEKLRGVVWGDPICHVMKLYASRIEALAVGAVTAKGY
ncbi:alpha/beta-hydrolase [Nemania sp. NC0429]|nr:alpha/beta-hydrolase [Nemania sp. NC0429]